MGFYEYYVGKSLHNVSHGELFLTLVSERLRGNGLYIFDEPEVALSSSNLTNIIENDVWFLGHSMWYNGDRRKNMIIEWRIKNEVFRSVQLKT